MTLKRTVDLSGANANPSTLLTKPSSGGISGDLQLLSNTLRAGTPSNDSWGYDSTNSYTDNQYVRWTVGVVGGKDYGGVLQMSAGGNGYYTTAGATGGNIDEYEVTGGSSFSLLTSVGAQTYALSDRFYKDVTGGAIRLFRGDDATGTLILSTTDGTPFTGGKPGYGAYVDDGGVSALLFGDDSAGGSSGKPSVYYAQMRR